jgi:chromosome partitioning protein
LEKGVNMARAMNNQAKPKILAFASTKGGVGKTTLAYSIATEIARRMRASNEGSLDNQNSGHPEYLISCIDADPNKTLTEALNITDEPGIQTLSADGETLLDVLRLGLGSSRMVLIDLEGTANQAMLYACGKADLVIIPAQPSRFDVVEAVKTAGVVRQAADLVGREITYRVVLSRTPVLKQRVASHSRGQFTKAELPMLETELVHRTAFQAMTYTGKPPYVQEVNGGAAANVAALTDEVLSILGLDHQFAETEGVA